MSPQPSARPATAAGPGPADPVGLALWGAGRFGQFCLEQYAAMPQVRVLGVADLDPAEAHAAADPYGIPVLAAEDLLADPAIELVYIGAPPSAHQAMARRALLAGKHVLLEKPLALSPEGGRALVELARDAERVLGVHHMLRYDPLCRAVGHLLDQRLLGAPLHASFENLASDELLPVEHWFWDKASSGGIFVEHGVHFFDLFAMWFGPGQVVAAQEVRRPGRPAVVDQVACTARFGSGVLAQLYHGFTQPTRMDRQLLRIACERGSIQLSEWVPTELTVDCLADAGTLAALEAILPNARVEPVEGYEGAARHATGRHRPIEADGRYRVHADVGLAKWPLYAVVVRAAMEDLAAAVRDPQHQRLVDETDALAALAMAARAEALAAGHGWMGPTDAEPGRPR
jgi:predicted dehydrogenase